MLQLLIMIRRKILDLFKLNFGLFVIFVIRLVEPVSGAMVKYDEPFPHRFPAVHVKSQVAFSQYKNYPMLSLDEIKQSFPWLEMSDAERKAVPREPERPAETHPRYIFYYVPSEVTLMHSVKSQSEPERQNHYSSDNINNHRFQVKNNEQKSDEAIRKSKHISDNKKSVNFDRQPLSIESFEDDDNDQEPGQSEHRIRAANRGIRAKNHKYRDGDFPVRSMKYKNHRGSEFLPSSLRPQIPSPYMQPPMLKFEEKEYWVKNKRKSKRPDGDSPTNEGRLKNHKTAKEKELNKSHAQNEERWKNHKPIYDREHDPEPHAESSSAEVGKLRKRPKDTPKNPLLLSEDGDRIDFQIHGHEGPQTYIFGYDTGNGDNRHFRLEERLRDGSVKGHYGYYDSNGKLKMVEYNAMPMGGFEEKHHHSEAYNSDGDDD